MFKKLIRRSLLRKFVLVCQTNENNLLNQSSVDLQLSDACGTNQREARLLLRDSVV